MSLNNLNTYSIKNGNNRSKKGAKFLLIISILIGIILFIMIGYTIYRRRVFHPLSSGPFYITKSELIF